jgi:hypothetical protein
MVPTSALPVKAVDRATPLTGGNRCKAVVTVSRLARRRTGAGLSDLAPPAPEVFGGLTFAHMPYKMNAQCSCEPLGAAQEFQIKGERMSKADFDAFLKRQQDEAAAGKDAEFDPQQQLQEWLSYLGELYVQIGDFLHTYVERGEAKIERRDVLLNEDFIGTYHQSCSSQLGTRKLPLRQLAQCSSEQKVASTSKGPEELRV